MTRRISWAFGVAALLLSAAAFGSSVSVGPNGANAIGLRRPDGVALAGSGVFIGQVETGRAAVRGFDSAANSNAFVVPFESRIQDGDSPNPDAGIADGHAVEVASVIIGTGGAPTSVAPNASLVSSGFISVGIDPGYQDSLITTQFVANRFQVDDTRHIRAINHSWGKLPPDLGDLDGNSLLTLGMDWIASEFDVLNIFAGPQGEDQQRVPADNFNGITVARSSRVGGVYLKVDEGNDNEDFDDAVGNRVSVDLIAPGVSIDVAVPGTSNPTDTLTGTSYAVPHVIGTVALLNQFSDYHVEVLSSPRWDIDNSRKHEVMKAVLLNSADKLNNVHGSRRTIVRENGTSTWLNSTAFTDPQVSLDQQMGAGHLNAARALRQFRSGEYNNSEDIPKIGWDYGETGGFGTTLVYPFEVSLDAGYIAITLAWDRKITKIGGDEDFYDPANMFSGGDVNDLDLFLVTADFDVGTDNPYDEGAAAAKSISTEDNVEHIFAQVPAGEYKILVSQGAGDDQDFGLAWWTGNNTPGDFNDDGDVDGADFGDWKSNFGTGDGADADFDGDSDGGDFLAWQSNFGAGVPAVPANTSIPEPTAWILCASSLLLLFRRRTA